MTFTGVIHLCCCSISGTWRDQSHWQLQDSRQFQGTNSHALTPQNEILGRKIYFLVSKAIIHTCPESSRHANPWSSGKETMQRTKNHVPSYPDHNYTPLKGGSSSFQKRNALSQLVSHSTLIHILLLISNFLWFYSK